MTISKVMRRSLTSFAAAVLLVLPWACSEPPGPGESTAEECSDGIDNDGDLLTDCDEVSCAAYCGGADGDGDGDADVDEDAEEEPAEAECLGPGEVCHDGRILRCEAAGAEPELVQDCTEPPYGECALGQCESGEEEPAPCCVADEPYCHAEVEVAGDSPLSVSYAGTWDDGHGCTGFVLDGAEFLFLVDSAALACEEGFVRVSVRGAIADFPPGEAVAICDGGRPRLSMSMSVTEVTDEGTFAAANYTGDDCTRAGGVFTMGAWGSDSGSPFAFEIGATLWSSEAAASRDVRIGADGSVVLY